MRSVCRMLFVGLLASIPSAGFAADETKGKSAVLDSRGRPDERLVDQPRRYYVWHDSEGWHLRSAAKGMNKFEGAVRVANGSFRRFRPVGLESTGKYADRWVLDAKRQELKFLIYTSTSFDGFDFDLGGGATELEFDLALAGAKDPKRVYVGRKALHPPGATFKLPVDPEKSVGGPKAP